MSGSAQSAGVRYRLADLLSLILLAKLGGEDEARGMAQWLAERAGQLVEALGLPRPTLPHDRQSSLGEAPSAG